MKLSFTKTWTVILTSLALTFSVIGVTPARAAGVVGDGTPGSCTETAFNVALIGGGAITFNCGPALKTITLTSTKYLKFAITIDGGGLITLDGNSGIRLFYMNTMGGEPAQMELKNITLIHGYAGAGGAVYIGVDQTVWMENVTIQGSHATGDGGAIYVDTNGTLTLTNVVFDGNVSGEEGGAVYNSQGTLNFTNVLFQENIASGWGGGIYNDTGNVALTNATLSANTAEASGGGIMNNDGDVTLTNATLSANTAVFSGGGIHNGPGAVAVLTNTTLSGNTADYGGGIYSYGGTATITNSTFSGNSASVAGGGIYNATNDPVTLRNTIVANSTAGGNCGGLITNGANNMEDGITCGWGSANGSMSSKDPLLGPLQDNGGPTLTRFPGPGSLAIDHGTNTGRPATDQRGMHRPQGAACDIGAVEVYLLYLPLVIR